MTDIPNDICLTSSIAEISWKAFSSNWNIVCSKLPKNVGILPMVKTNAYGHDLQIIAEYCTKLSAIGLGVANIFEALELRSLGYEKQIISFGRLSPETLDAAFEFDIHVVVHNPNDVDLLLRCPHEISFHLEMETGMNRLGVRFEEIDDVLDMLKKKPHKMKGVFTHFVESEIKGSAYTRRQIQKFQRAISYLRSKRLGKLITHAENSGGIFNQNKHFDWVRPGLALYGYHPNEKATKHGLRPVLEWSAPIIQINRLKKGDYVSYNRSFRAKKNMVIATLPVGYGDGFSRKYKTQHVGYQDQSCAIVGNICMDLMMIDISRVKNPQVGDMVYLLGPGDHGEASAWNHAKVDRTIPYEVLTRISPRVIRTPST